LRRPISVLPIGTGGNAPPLIVAANDAAMLLTDAQAHG